MHICIERIMQNVTGRIHKKDNVTKDEKKKLP